MKPKKTPKADLQNKRGLMLEIGLVISLLLVIAAFIYTPKERTIEAIDLNLAPIDEEIIEITKQEEQKPEPPKKVAMQVLTDVLNVVTNDTKIETSIDFTEFDEDVEIVANIPVEEAAVQEDNIFVIVEEMPSFQGGDLNTFRSWVQGKVKYPQIAQENGISGKVTVEFVVEKDGTLTNIKVLATPDRTLSDETVRVLKESPKWKPGKQRNAPVRVRYTLPVEFRIQN